MSFAKELAKSIDKLKTPSVPRAWESSSDAVLSAMLAFSRDVLVEASMIAPKIFVL